MTNQKPPEDGSGSGRDDADESLADAYCVIVISPYGNPRRRIYLTLNHATAAVKRAEGRGLPVRMVLCRLVPVQADLDGRAKNFTGESVEVDAIPTSTLRPIVEDAITSWIDPERLRITQTVEAQELEGLRALASGWSA
jgi:hypothetical protein